MMIFFKILEIKQDWPRALKDWATAVRAVLAGFGVPVGVDEVAGAYNGRYGLS